VNLPQPASQRPGDALLLRDALATQAWGSQLATQLQTSDFYPPILLLSGDLGAGKTCLVQGIAAGLGIEEGITSPTFALAQHYQGGTTALVHLDLYRLEQAAAADELFAQEEEEARALGALLAVEWPERLSRLPAEAWHLRLDLAEPNEPNAGRIARLHGPRLTSG
jgi:tRNA threonylcarbamoyladenosine biosynthesis protein TsaE